MQICRLFGEVFKFVIYRPWSPLSIYKYSVSASAGVGNPLCRGGGRVSTVSKGNIKPAGHPIIPFWGRECIAYIGCRIPRQSGAGTGAVSSDFHMIGVGRLHVHAHTCSLTTRLLSFFALSSYNAETDNTSTTSTTITIQKMLIKWKIPLLLLPNKNFTFKLLYSHHIDIFFWLVMWSLLLWSNPLETWRYQPHHSYISTPYCIIMHCNVMYL